jgi:hypothetical protein
MHTGAACGSGTSARGSWLGDEDGLPHTLDEHVFICRRWLQSSSNPGCIDPSASTPPSLQMLDPPHSELHDLDLRTVSPADAGRFEQAEMNNMAMVLGCAHLKLEARANV